MTRMNWLPVAIILALSSVIAVPAAAQPVRDRVLRSVEFFTVGEVAVARIRFNFPVRYLRHAPLLSGDQLIIQFRTIAVSPGDLDALFKRESIRPRQDNPAQVLEVIYEGSLEGGPVLTVRFQTERAYRVTQGEDYRSLDIAVLPEEADQGEEP